MTWTWSKKNFNRSPLSVKIGATAGTGTALTLRRGVIVFDHRGKAGEELVDLFLTALGTGRGLAGGGLDQHLVDKPAR